jgi:hypothetical protein
MLVLKDSECFVDTIGLAGHKVSQFRNVTAQALLTTHKGDVIATFHQMALLGKGKSIFSCLQMEAHVQTLTTVQDCYLETTMHPN